MEVLGSMVFVGLLFVFVVSIAALFRPLPQLWISNRRQARIVAAVSFGLLVVVANLLPEPGTKPEPAPESPSMSCASDDLNCLANKYLARAHDTCNAFMRLHWRSVPNSKWREVSQQNGWLVFSDWAWIDRSLKHGILYFGDQIIIDGNTYETPEPFTCRYGFDNDTGYFDLD